LIELRAYRTRQHEGFTLVEMLVALAVSSIVVAGAIQVTLTLQRNTRLSTKGSLLIEMF
jgi:prepilin-type N-terminal cleavage/methylation domain-containing protein